LLPTYQTEPSTWSNKIVLIGIDDPDVAIAGHLAATALLICTYLKEKLLL